MTKDQWMALNSLISGKTPERPLTGFIIDSPWIPGWYGISTLEYYSSERSWMDANIKAIETFPDSLFLPGFWSEYGMCSEPSAFGAKCIWQKNDLPHADKIMSDLSRVSDLRCPNPESDGMLPFIIERLLKMQPEIIDMGHEIKFAVARGPLNIASFLMGTTELMMAIMLQAEEMHHFMRIVTDFSKKWIQYQKEVFPSIEGILLLDDIVGFVGEPELKAFAVPYIKEIFNSFDADIRFFHNDANGLASTPFLEEMGVNLFNYSFEHSINDIRKLAGPNVALLGNLPPRDVMAAGTREQVIAETKKMVEECDDKQGIIWSVGGGMSQDTPTDNIIAFVETINLLL
jgi:uroporphyrinogen-III decarboxylase